jgi:nitrate reductase beta subunit
MNVLPQTSMLFHLDKCIGCNTCTVACKNLWTDRKGAEYMWWNNVETRPGTGYPAGWEDQSYYRGGWQVEGGKLKLRLHSRPIGLANLFFNPAMPELEDYYSPFTFRYQELFDAPAGDDQPTAVPVSLLSGEPMEIESGPNWDDDLSGSDLYARNDPNLAGMDAETRAQLEGLERLVMQYLPRICNHCLNPACAAACPSGAIYKRAMDGIVLVNQQRCRAWRMCVAGCPYKKVYYNWHTGKAEKCILCYPRLEEGHVSGCAHTCVGRIRYIGVVLYDADRIPEAVATADDQELVVRQRAMILDPFDPEVLAEARASGLDESWIDAAQRSPIYHFVKAWELALPLHPEYRTLPMMFYVPPLSPIVGQVEDGLFRLDLPEADVDFELFHWLDGSRLPIRYLANMFGGGNEDLIRRPLKKMIAVRLYRRRAHGADGVDGVTADLMAEAGTSVEEAERIFRLTTLASWEERFVLPAYRGEEGVEALQDPLAKKGEVGLGYLEPPRRIA